MIVPSIDKAQKRKWAEEKAMKKIQKRMDSEQKIKSEEESKRIAKEEKGRGWTLSIALPGSIVDNAQSDELRTYLAGQVCFIYIHVRSKIISRFMAL